MRLHSDIHLYLYGQGLCLCTLGSSSIVFCMSCLSARTFSSFNFGRRARDPDSPLLCVRRQSCTKPALSGPFTCAHSKSLDKIMDIFETWEHNSTATLPNTTPYTTPHQATLLTLCTTRHGRVLDLVPNSNNSGNSN